MIDFRELRKKLKSLPFIGEGSARKVYDLGNGKVAKVAINEKGNAQNRVEVRISKKDSKSEKPLNIFTQVFFHNSAFSIIIVEKCNQVKNLYEVKKLIDTEEAAYYKLMNEIERRYNLISNDLDKKSSWGMNSQNQPILIDYGFTRQVWQKYY